MSTLEKFGILVILILVVIIGVVAVWGVGGDATNPFENGDGTATAAADPAVPAEPGADAATWPDGAGGAPAVSASQPTGPVPPPAIGAGVTPPAAPAAVPAAPASGGGTYTVKSGDTLEKIAKMTMGDGTKWQQIVAANPGLTPKRLKIGQVLKIPGGGLQVADAGTAPAAPGARPNTLLPVNPDDGASGASEVSVAAPVAAPREVEVRSGDTLYEIARRELGDPNLYYKILKANPGLDPKRLRPGMKVKMPVE